MKILFISLGCDKNLVDTEMMLGILSQRGHTFTDDEQEAAIARLVYFVEHCWTEILRFSRRTQGQADGDAGRWIITC